MALRHAIRINGITQLAVTKLDVLSLLPEYQICVAYELPDGTQIDRFPFDPVVLEQVKPVLQSFVGIDKLPENSVVSKIYLSPLKVSLRTWRRN